MSAAFMERTVTDALTLSDNPVQGWAALACCLVMAIQEYTQSEAVVRDIAKTMLANALETVLVELEDEPIQ